MVRERTDKSSHPVYASFPPRKGVRLMGQPPIRYFSAGWRQLYECAILELDNGRLPERITLARRAILDRAEEVLTSPAGEEHRALNDALRALRILEEVAARENTQH